MGCVHAEMNSMSVIHIVARRHKQHFPHGTQNASAAAHIRCILSPVIRSRDVVVSNVSEASRVMLYRCDCYLFQDGYVLSGVFLYVSLLATLRKKY